MGQARLDEVAEQVAASVVRRPYSLEPEKRTQALQVVGRQT